MLLGWWFPWWSWFWGSWANLFVLMLKKVSPELSRQELQLGLGWLAKCRYMYTVCVSVFNLCLYRGGGGISHFVVPLPVCVWNMLCELLKPFLDGIGLVASLCSCLLSCYGFVSAILFMVVKLEGSRRGFLCGGQVLVLVCFDLERIFQTECMVRNRGKRRWCVV